MKLDWSFAAESYLDQLPSEERARVTHAVKKLPVVWDSLDGTQLQKLPPDNSNLFQFRVGFDFLVLVIRQDDVITVVDVVPRSQVERLRQHNKRRQAAVG